MTSEEAREWLRSIKDNYIHGGDEAFDDARREALSMADEALRCKPCDDAVSRDLMTNTLGATCIAKRDEKGDLVALCSIDHLPSVTPEPRTGHWISHREHCEQLGVLPSGLGFFYWCSNCDYGLKPDMLHEANYCPNCGTKMEETRK